MRTTPPQRRKAASKPRPRTTAHFDPAAVAARAAELCAHLPLREQQTILGVSHESLRRYHLGLVRPSLGYIARLCIETGASAEWLLFGHGEKMAAGRKPARHNQLAQA